MGNRQIAASEREMMRKKKKSEFDIFPFLSPSLPFVLADPIDIYIEWGQSRYTTVETGYKVAMGNLLPYESCGAGSVIQ